MEPDLITVFKNFSEDGNKDEIDISAYDIWEFPQALLLLPKERLKYLSLDHNDLKTLPVEFCQFSSLKHLSIVGNELEEFLISVETLVNLENLNLNENQLTSLPEDIGQLQLLRVFSAIGNKLSVLPLSIVNLELLEELYLDENKLTHLPENFSQLKSLKSLEVMNNQLTSLPIDIGLIKTLQVLNFNVNCISFLPDSFSELQVVTFLDFSNNRLEYLPEKFGCAGVVEKLILENNAIECLPAWFHNLHNIEEISLSSNLLQDEPIDDEFCENSPYLRRLDLGANFMSSLSEKFGCLKSLEYLRIGSVTCELERSNFQNGNWLNHLPDSFCELTRLEKANLNENQIAYLPERFGELCSLTWLDLGQNMLRYLPSSFCQLINIEFLQLSKNQLEALPDNIGNMTKLTELRLDNNLITNLPDSVANITCLACLDLFHNRLEKIPDVVMKLKNLKCLDIDENEFQIDLKNIPKITPGNSYPERDPSLENNWRGKTRADKICNQNVTEYNFTGDENIERKETQWNYNALKDAMKKGISMWRSHNDDEHRKISAREKENKVDDDEWLAYGFTIPSLKKTKLKKTNPDEEDWDQEIEQNNELADVTNIFHKRKGVNSVVIDDFQNTINRYPPANQCYTSSADYSSFVHGKHAPKEPLQAQLSRFTVDDGQFDDD